MDEREAKWLKERGDALLQIVKDTPLEKLPCWRSFSARNKQVIGAAGVVTVGQFLERYADTAFRASLANKRKILFRAVAHDLESLGVLARTKTIYELTLIKNEW